ncbi:MAG: FAD-dependent oxidoreductase [Saprospiraceae bacterium]|nr:FAD-dependent oxidoreductase [Saprospiraceae bacterium]
MLKATVDILRSYSQAEPRCVMGNVAIARGAIEAGVQGVFAYPGTPSTEISEVFKHVDAYLTDPGANPNQDGIAVHELYFEYSINEKIALEKAIAFAVASQRAMCVMKNVGMNVASDALMSIPYQTFAGALVIVLCDDPGCHSSSNEQDSRWWGTMASVPVLNPATPQEAKELTQQAFSLSEAIHLPVIVRSTTRVSHARGMVIYGELPGSGPAPAYDRVPEHINIPSRNTGAHQALLARIARPEVQASLQRCTRKLVEASTSRAVICSGITVAYLLELHAASAGQTGVSILEIQMVHPFPESEVLAFLRNGYDQVLVLEELDPIVENNIRLIAQKHGMSVDVFGKGFSGLTSAGEYSLDLVAKALHSFSGAPVESGIPLPAWEAMCKNLPPRPPALCSGCPHRATFYLLKLAMPRENRELVLCGDIGCFGLGALPPLKMIDTINHMGMSISMAQGLSTALARERKSWKTVALVGDGTFFHSGLASLVNAVYTRANVLVVIFDNRTIGMTGHQSHPGAARRLPKYREIELAPMLKGLGIEMVETINPFELREGMQRLNRAMQHEGVSVVIAQSPCIFLPEFKEGMPYRRRIAVDPKRCNSCGNHEDLSLSCSRRQSPSGNLVRARAKLMAPKAIAGERQLCPANICNHGFFFAIRDGDYRSAIEIVRDKMLFARTCGDICHRPCELFAGMPDKVPVKALKKFVSGIDEHFFDFSIPIARAEQAAKSNWRVAIVGAGPAGLSAAYDLLQAGYSVDVFERRHEAGGMVIAAIPGFRMDKQGFRFEAGQLEAMGARFHFGKSLGSELELSELAAQWDAVVLALGQWRPATLPVLQKLNGQGPRVDAVHFLERFNEGLDTGIPDGDLLVVGGGNSAIDAARAARKLFPSRRVVVSCLEREEEMPAFAEEIAHARNEGVEIWADTMLARCEASQTLHVTLNRYSSGEAVAAFTVGGIISAIGQQVCFEDLGGPEAAWWDGHGRLDPEALRREYPNVFVAGDLCSGTHRSVIGAIASGKRAANSIRRHLENYPYAYEGEQTFVRLCEDSTKTNVRSLVNGKEAGAPVYEEAVLPQDWTTRMEFFNLFQSCMKCNHCIENFGCPAMVMRNGKVVIDDNACTLCGLCIDVCPNDAIRWVAIETEEELTLT